VLESHSIPVRISSRRRDPHHDSSFRRSRHLVQIKPNCHLRRRPRINSLKTYSPSIMMANLRSISNKFDELSLKMTSIKPDIAIFVETWLDSSSSDSSLFIPGFRLIRKDRDSRGGGVILYINEVFDFCNIDASKVPSVASCKSEILSVFSIELSLLVIAIYHPFWNDASKDTECIMCITEIIDFALINFGCDPCTLRIVLCGDFNDLRKRTKDISDATQLFPIIEEATRGKNVLDQIFTNITFTGGLSVLPPLGKSDHALILWRQSRNRRPCAIKKKVRNYSLRNRIHFDSQVRSYDWLALVDSESNLDNAALLFLNCLQELFSVCFPYKTIRFRSSDPPWMRSSLKFLIDQRDRAFSQGHMHKYRRLCNEVVRHTRDLKKNFLEAAVHSESPKQLWKSLRSSARHFSPTEYPLGFTPHAFDRYFSSFFQSFDNSDAHHGLLRSVTPSHADNLIVSTEYVEALLSRLRRRSSGPDGIPFWVFRTWSDILAPAVCALFNRSLSSCTVPACFKAADVKPIPKISKPTDLCHFRPISLLPLLSKVLERIVLDNWIFPYVSSNFDASQFAYFPGRGGGTTTALTLLYHRIVHFLDSPGAIRLLTVDFSKAFDKLPHDRIIEACLKFDLPRQAILWIESFLTNRKQRVRLGDGLSDWSFVTSGVPQGSVLGPILFCLVTDSLKPVCSNTKIIKYADDITFLHFLRHSGDDKLQSEWNNCIDWSARVKLPVNVDKCCVMDFQTKRSISLAPISINNDFLPSVKSLKLLGVTLTSDMKWNQHIDNILTKASKRVFILRNLRRAGCPSNLTTRAYCAFIRSIILYAFPCFCNASSYLLLKLERLEKRCFRIISSDFQMRPLRDISNSICAKLFQEVLSCDAHPLRELFTPNEDSRILRHSKTLKAPFAKTKRFGSSFVKFARSSF